MVLKINQLKKLNLKELKGIVKKHKLGKIAKKKKAQLIGMISNCENCKIILSALSLPIRKRKPPSAKQLAARKRFGDAARARKLVKHPTNIVKKPMVQNEAKIKAQKELEDGLKEPVKHKIINGVDYLMGNSLQNGRPNIRPMGKVIKKKEIVETIKEEVKAPVKLIEKVADVVDDLISKKQFLDNIFGVSIFNFQEMLTDLLNEVEDEGKLMTLMSKPKKELKSFLMKAFENADSIAEMINSI